MIKGRGVCRVLFWTLISTVVKDSAGNFSGFHGFVGCESDPSVCNLDERCVDDCLFGSCQSPEAFDGVLDDYCYDLSDLQLFELEIEVSRLQQAGFTWQDLYTQCVVGNILISYRSGLPFDSSFCESSAIRREIEDQISNDAVRLLEKYFLDYYTDPPQHRPENAVSPYDGAVDFPVPQEKDGYPPLDDLLEFYHPVDKKDEFVQVHKYLKSHKRAPLDSGLMDYEDLYNDLRPLEVEQPDDSEPYGQGSDYLDYDALLRDVSLSDLQYLYDYLTAPEILAPDVDYDYSTEYPDDSLGYTPYNPSKDVMVPSGYDRQDEAIASMERENEAASDPAFTSMTPEDAKLLSDLMQEKISVSDLSEDEIERLYQYIESMIEEMEADTDYVEPEPEALTQGKLAKIFYDTGSDDFEPEANDEVTEEPDDMDEQKRGGQEDGNDTEIQPDIQPHNQPEKAFKGVDSLPEGEMDRPESVDDFENHTDRPADTKQQFGIIQSDAAWLEVRNQQNKGVISSPDATAFLRQLEPMMSMPPKTLLLQKVAGKEMIFRIDRTLTDYNGTYVADFALNHKAELYNKTELLVVDGGVLGDGEDHVSVAAIHHKPGKYFVLTFILCGAVAGIVLAVIIIYFIRRHSQQRWKLQQIAKSGDGEIGETATKDYQDLCRQRMQSKTSDKPEPVHSACGRVGPGADIPPRSTHSSRSSTSSW